MHSFSGSCMHIYFYTTLSQTWTDLNFLSLSLLLHPSVKRCCVMSSWLQEALKCQLTGWSLRPVAPTSVPCSQVDVYYMFSSHHTWCVHCYVFNCVCFSVSRWYEWEQGSPGGDQRGGWSDPKKTGGLHLHCWDWGHRGQRPGESVCIRVFMKREEERGRECKKVFLFLLGLFLSFFLC